MTSSVITAGCVNLFFATVPQDFSYISERSLIRAVVTVLSEAGKKGFHPRHGTVTVTPASFFRSQINLVLCP